MTTEIKPGDRVRSHDFAHVLGRDSDRPACYAEGVVLRITEPMEGCPRYEIAVDRRVLDGEEVPVREEEKKVYPPVNGTRSWMGGVTNGVEKVDAEPTARPPAAKPR